MFGVGRREFDGFRDEVFRRFDAHDKNVDQRHRENAVKADELSDSVKEIYRLLWRFIFGLIAVLLGIAAAFFKIHVG